MFQKIIAKPFLFFFWLVPIFIVIALTYTKIDIVLNIHDSYFVVSNNQFYLLSAIFFCMIGINYYALHWANRPPKKWLTIIHLVLQTVSLILVFTSNRWNWILGASNLEIDLTNENSKLIIVLSFLIFFFSIIIHIINFLISIFLKSE